MQRVKIDINEFDYPLPDERIAKFPLDERSASKLLVYRKGEISHRRFFNLKDELPEGSYPFSIYAWNYVGMHPTFKVVPVCENKIIADEILSILQVANTSNKKANVDKNTWVSLEPIHLNYWFAEKDKYIANVQGAANYKLESISSSYRNRKRNLEQKIRDAYDDRIIRMYQSELQSATENYNARVSEINDKTSRADIHTTMVANGIIDIRRG